ncbi:MAG: GTP-binding protein, partial [Bacteroidota bacterium]
HQEITERFIPSSDLIVFVFEAKNPYRQSAWEFFDYIHRDWQKKIIFVLQQKDLMSVEDLAVNVQGVVDYAQKKGIDSPSVFAVSAKLDMEGQTTDSGFGPLRAYIQQNITGGQAPRLKLVNSIQTAQTINHRIADGLALRRGQFEADTSFREDVRKTLDEQEAKSNKQVDLMTENLLLTYDKITSNKLGELKSGLSMFGLIRRSFASTFSKTPGAKAWLENMAVDLENELNTQLKQRLNEGVVDLADSIQQMARLIDLKLRSSETILKNDDELFSAIAERREGVLRDLQDQFNRFVSNTDNFTDEALFSGRENLAPNIVAGGGIAALGVILMALSTFPVFDITGGVLTSIGVLFAGFSTRGKRRKIVKGFAEEVQRGRQQMGNELDERLKSYIHQLRVRIEDNFKRFDEMLAREEDNLRLLEDQQSSIQNELKGLQMELSS